LTGFFFSDVIHPANRTRDGSATLDDNHRSRLAAATRGRDRQRARLARGSLACLLFGSQAFDFGFHVSDGHIHQLSGDFGLTIDVIGQSLRGGNGFDQIRGVMANAARSIVLSLEHFLRERVFLHGIIMPFLLHCSKLNLE
jgi:hypothetical protein